MNLTLDKDVLANFVNVLMMIAICMTVIAAILLNRPAEKKSQRKPAEQKKRDLNDHTLSKT